MWGLRAGKGMDDIRWQNIKKNDGRILVIVQVQWWVYGGGGHHTTLFTLYMFVIFHAKGLYKSLDL